MINIKELQNWYLQNFEEQLLGRYIHSETISSLLNSYSAEFKIDIIGKSVNDLAIHRILLGNGPKRIMMWSQMHGNESTTTKAIFDLLKLLSINNDFSENILSSCTLCIIPILSPDGAKAYTRINANDIDLNRDAQDLTQPESRVLKEQYTDFKPHFCFNLHDQRTIFSAGSTNKPATVSFLSPAQDKERSITNTRKKSMEIISVMNTMLQKIIPDQVGRYDDGFNINCVGDTFQSLGVPTILFESGHYKGDYNREKTREFIFYSLIQAITYISNNNIKGDIYETYFDIPENDKLFLDIIYRDFPLISDGKELKTDIGIFFKEILENGKIKFSPQVERVGDLSHLFGHEEVTSKQLKYEPMDIERFALQHLSKK